MAPSECLKAWGPEQKSAFEKLKVAVSTAPVLVKPRFDDAFIMDTDASDYAVGAVLSQLGQDNLEHPVYFHSRLLTPAERNYSVTEKECLAIVVGVAKFRAYILGNHTTVRTDHAPIRGLLKRFDLTGRCARWRCLLSEYDLSLQTRRGRQHQNMDGLSRMLTMGQPDVGNG